MAFEHLSEQSSPLARARTQVARNMTLSFRGRGALMAKEGLTIFDNDEDMPE